MPCDTMVQNVEERRVRDKALEELRLDIEEGRRKIVKNILTGEVSITGWAETAACKSGWCEGCILARLSSQASTRPTRSKWAARASSQLEQAGVTKGERFVAASHNGHSHKVK